jgi:Tfp pilus assembly protein FimT
MEVLVVTSFIAILAGIAVPQYAALSMQMRTSAVTTQLTGDLNFARVMSQRTGTPHYIAVVPGSAVVYKIQRSAAPPVIAPSTDPVLRNVNQAAKMPNVGFSLNGATVDPYGNAVAAAAPNTLAFNARGLPAGTGSFFVTSTDGRNAYSITVTGAGRVRVWKKVGGSWR